MNVYCDCLIKAIGLFFVRRKKMRIAGWVVIIGSAASGLGLILAPKAYGEPADFPSLISSIKIEAPLDFCGEKVPMEDREIRERLEKELLVSLWDRAQVILWLKRSGRYLPHIEETLNSNKMPEDIKYVAIAESGLRSHAGSGKGAVGFWQFMPGTGLKYGLEIDEDKDDRRNFFASTDAAIRYFTELHQKFGSWTLAAAAYNMGEDGLMAEALEQDTNNFYQLYLPLETQQYVFRILAIKLIFNNPEKYGFKLSDDDYYPPVAFDRVRVTCPGDIPIRIIARAGGTSFKTVKDLNPEIRGYFLPKGTYEILVPRGASHGFPERLRKLTDQYRRDQIEKTYIVQKGDSLSSIAERFGIPLRALIIWNRLDFDRTIHPGDRIYIFTEKMPPGSGD